MIIQSFETTRRESFVLCLWLARLIPLLFNLGVLFNSTFIMELRNCIQTTVNTS
jgi:hypothetical protein